MATPKYLAVSQFVGKIELMLGNYPQFDDFAVWVEKKYIDKVLTYEYRVKLFKDQFDHVDEEALYGRILNGLTSGWTNEAGILVEMVGIKEMLKWFFAYEFLTTKTDQRNKESNAETVYINKISGARDSANLDIVGIWNQGVEYYNQIVEYLTKQKSDTDYFDNWTYVKLEKINSFGI